MTNAPWPPLPPTNEDGFYYFTKKGDERLFFCSETGERGISPGFVRRLDQLRHRCGFPFNITSGYRSPQHSVEAKKARPGQHSEGWAADIAVKNGEERRKIVEEAIKMGFAGIGVADTFVHVDDRGTNPVMWTY